MGHLANPGRQYRLLQQRLDRTVTGAPDSPSLAAILRLLYSGKDVELATRIPGKLTRLADLAASLEVPADELGDQLTALAGRGLVLDLEHGGEKYFALPPIVIGFFEFTFMRSRDTVDMAQLSQLFEQYMNEDDRFARSVFQGQTQIGRSLVHEEALPDGNHSEILAWERASHIVESATTVGVSLCACRHKASHLGKACDHEQEACLSLNYAADSLIGAGHARRITTAEAMHVLQRCKEAGLAQTGDNVQRKVTYICNCCGCCCEMFHAIKRFDLRGAVVTSNFIMRPDLEHCNGCGACVKACPIDAICLTEVDENGAKQKRAEVDDTLCLGCGACYPACKFGGVQMVSRPQRVIIPETVFDRVVTMAMERGKLAELVFDNPEKLTHRALGRIVSAVERSVPFKAAMAVRPLKSVFLNGIVWGAKKSSGDLREMLE